VKRGHIGKVLLEKEVIRKVGKGRCISNIIYIYIYKYIKYNITYDNAEY